MLDVGRDRTRHLARTAAAKTGRHRDVLLPTSRESDGITGRRCAETRLPERFAGPHIKRAERAIEVADERYAARRRQHAGEKRRTLFLAPDLFHRVGVVGDEFSDVAVAARHLEESSRRACTAGAVDFLNIAALHLHARLAEWNDQQAGRLVVAHGLPVVSAFRARA